MSLKTIENMVDWVEINIDAEPTLEKMSAHVGYSSYYCSSRFHEVVGLTFKTYVVKRKLSCAAKDLVNSKARIIDIATRYGFSSHEAFTRSFKKEYNMSPSQFRQACTQFDSFEKHTFKHSKNN